jgi:RNA polymerase primary sigma factor
MFSRKSPLTFRNAYWRGRGWPVRDFIEDKEVISPQDATISSNMAKRIQKVLSTLNEREEKILRMRFGIGGKHDQYP